MDDEADDLYPVRERDATFTVITRSSLTGERRLASQLKRDELEDRFLHLHEEHYRLKKYAQEQEEKIKQLSTKLMRQLNCKKKSLSQEGKDGKQRHEIELQELLEDREEQIRALQKQNIALKEKLSLAKQSAKGAWQPSLYQNVKSRIDTGLPEKVKQRLKSKPSISRRPMPLTRPNKTAANRGSTQNQRKSYSPSSPVSIVSGKLLEEAYDEVKKLEGMVASQNAQISAYEQELQALRDQIRLRVSEEEDGFSSLRAQIVEGRRNQVQENVDLARLHRDVKQKSAKLSTLQIQYLDLEEKMKALKESNEMLLHDFDVLQSRLTEEQKKNLELHTELRKTAMTHKTILELQQQVSDLQRENSLLRESNDKLIASALDLEKNELYVAKEKSLRLQMNQLEVAFKAELEEKMTLLKQISEEKAKFSQLDTAHKRLLDEQKLLTTKLEDTEKELSKFTKGGNVDMSELEAALSLIKQQEVQKKESEEKLEFLQKIDEHEEKDLSKKLAEVEAHLAETAAELEQTRSMLNLQYKINQDYQAELEAVNKQATVQGKEYKTKLEEYVHLLDLRNARIKKLERQLRDIAYGTKQYSLAEALQDENSHEAEETVQLERGQNLLEIHIDKIILSKEWLHAIGNARDITTFLTWEFYEYELQSTPVMKGESPEFNCTSQYIVRMDDFLLHYLNKESIKVELHQAFGTEYQTIASCQIRCNTVLEYPQKQNHGKQDLTGVKSGSENFVYGTVYYWIRLHLPAEQALLQHKERLKGISYLENNFHVTENAIKALNSQYAILNDSRMNELHIKIIRCAGLSGKHKGSQPSAYCIYKFYNLADQDTAIIPSSNDPFFDDHRTFNLCMDGDLDNYLRKSDLEIYIFDDSDPEIGCYLGKASVPLLPLAHNKMLKGKFHLRNETGDTVGTIDVSLYWLFPYNPPISEIHLEAFDEPLENTTPDILKEKSSEDQESRRVPVPLPRTSLASRRNSSLTKPEIAGFNETELLKAGGENEGSESNGHNGNVLPKDGNADSPVNGASSPPIVPSSPASEAPSSVSPRSIVKSTAENGNNEDLIEDDANGQEVEDEQEAEEEEEEEEEDVSEDEEEEELEEEILEENDEDEEKKEIKDKLKVNDGSSSGSESAEVVILSPSRRSNSNKLEDIIVITVASLQLTEESKILNNPQIQMLFVEYQFLDYPPEELETPFSLPKPQPPQSVTYNFRKVFHIDTAHHKDKRKLLREMLTSKKSGSGKIVFTVVSEPPENEQDLDCEEVGFCWVDVKKVLETKRDLIDEPFEIYDVQDGKTVIGYLNITVEASPALQAVITDI